MATLKSTTSNRHPDHRIQREFERKAKLVGQEVKTQPTIVSVSSKTTTKSLPNIPPTPETKNYSYVGEREYNFKVLGSGGTNNTGSAVPDWSPGVSYNLNDLVTYSNIVYQCNFPHTSATTWIEDEYVGYPFTTWLPNTNYYIGDKVIGGDGRPYICNETHISSPSIWFTDNEPFYWDNMDLNWAMYTVSDPTIYEDDICNRGCSLDKDTYTVDGWIPFGKKEEPEGIEDIIIPDSPSSTTNLMQLSYLKNYEIPCYSHQSKRKKFWYFKPNKSGIYFINASLVLTGPMIIEFDPITNISCEGMLILNKMPDIANLEWFGVRPTTQSLDNFLYYNPLIYSCIPYSIQTIPDWIINHHYIDNQYVKDGGHYYRCLVSHTSDLTNEPSNPTYWVQVTSLPTQLLQPVNYPNAQYLSLWITGRDYIENQTIINSGVYYVCKITHTSSDFAVDLYNGNWEVITFPQYLNHWATNWILSKRNWDKNIYVHTNWGNPGQLPANQNNSNNPPNPNQSGDTNWNELLSDQTMRGEYTDNVFELQGSFLLNVQPEDIGRVYTIWYKLLWYRYSQQLVEGARGRIWSVVGNGMIYNKSYIMNIKKHIERIHIHYINDRCQPEPEIWNYDNQLISEFGFKVSENK